MTELNIQFSSWLQSLGGTFLGLMDVLALFVKIEFLIVLFLPILIWKFSYRIFAPLFALLMFDVMLGDITKVLLAQPRLWWIADLLPIDPVTSLYSSPSGYASMATVFWGYLYRTLGKPIYIWIGALFIVVTGIAKITHAAAMIDHIVLGAGQGLVVLWGYEKIKGRLSEVFKSSSYISWTAISVIITTGMLVLMWLAFVIHDTYEIPMEFLEFKMIASDRFSGGGIILAAGFFLGAMLGQKLLYQTQISPVSNKSNWFATLQTIVGLIILGTLMIAIRGALVEGQDRLMEGILNFIVTTACGFFMLYGVHRLFHKTKINSETL